MPDLVQAVNPIVKTPAEEKGYGGVFTGVLNTGAALASIDSVTIFGNRTGDDPAAVLEFVVGSNMVNVATVVDRVTGESHPPGEVALFRLVGGIAGRNYWASVIGLDDEATPNKIEGWFPVWVRSPVA